VLTRLMMRPAPYWVPRQFPTRASGQRTALIATAQNRTKLAPGFKEE
jgi:hypothetical protein